MQRSTINVNGCKVDTDKITDADYERALEIGLYALVITGELNLVTILATPEVRDNIVTLSRRTMPKIET